MIQKDQMIHKSKWSKKANDPKKQMIQKSNGLKYETVNDFNIDILCLWCDRKQTI